MNGLVETLIDGAQRLLNVVPLLLIFSLVLYSMSDEAGKAQIDSLILQTPAKGLVSGGYDYYPSSLDDNDVIVKKKVFIDENGDEYTGAVIEVRRPVAFATPADTGSMQPMFGAGNLLVQEVVDENTNLQKGDIVVYENEGRLIIHQIIEEVNGSYIVKGMNNVLPDTALISKESIEYRLLFAIPTS